tara:strand:- start:1535 stop:3304 length:1770 start_codon:yes stop_codon:yes gene_type:complete
MFILKSSHGKNHHIYSYDENKYNFKNYLQKILNLNSLDNVNEICDEYLDNKIIHFQRENTKILNLNTNKSWYEKNFLPKIKYNITYEDNFFYTFAPASFIDKTYDELKMMKYEDLNKDKTISCIVSTKVLSHITPNYQKRVNFIKKYSGENKNNIDIYGYGWNKQILGDNYKGELGSYHNNNNNTNNTSKSLGLVYYNYSICLENLLEEKCISEKATDAILCWCIPLYWGNHCIKKYFPEKSYHLIDIENPNINNKINEIIKNKPNNEEIKNLEEARNIILDKLNIWEQIYQIINNYDKFLIDYKINNNNILGNIKINLWSGLCNQLLPLISCIYFGKVYNKNVIFNLNPLICCGQKTCYYLTEFLKLPFCKESKELLKNETKDICIITNNENYVNKIENKQLLENNNIFIHGVVHLIGTESDNYLYNPQPITNLKKTEYLLKISDILKEIELIDYIKFKILETTSLFNDDVIGIHFRCRDGGFITNNKFKLKQFIDTLPSNKKIYLSSDDKESEIYIKEIFKERIITLQNPFGDNINSKTNNSKEAIMNGICEIYILSKCQEFYGTKGSSFTFTVWLLSNINTLMFWN